MNSSSGVWPSRNFSASLSKSSNSCSMIGIRWPGNVVVDLRVLERPEAPLAALRLVVTYGELVFGGDALGDAGLWGGGRLHARKANTLILTGI